MKKSTWYLVGGAVAGGLLYLFMNGRLQELGGNVNPTGGSSPVAQLGIPSPTVLIPGTTIVAGKQVNPSTITSPSSPTLYSYQPLPTVTTPTVTSPLVTKTPATTALSSAPSTPPISLQTVMKPISSGPVGVTGYIPHTVIVTPLGSLDLGPQISPTGIFGSLPELPQSVLESPESPALEIPAQTKLAHIVYSLSPEATNIETTEGYTYFNYNGNQYYVPNTPSEIGAKIPDLTAVQQASRALQAQGLDKATADVLAQEAQTSEVRSVGGIKLPSTPASTSPSTANIIGTVKNAIVSRYPDLGTFGQPPSTISTSPEPPPSQSIIDIIWNGVTSALSHPSTAPLSPPRTVYVK